MTEELIRLAALIRQRNAIDAEIAKIIGRPAEKGHVGEYLASHLFDIDLEVSATQKGYDGRFRSGPLAGRSVNVKWYAKREGLLDINPRHLPDYFLVLAGPRGPAASSRGTTRPWALQEIFLFEAVPLIAALKARNVAIGIATSLRREDWEAARVNTILPDPRLCISASAPEILQLLGCVDDGARKA